MAFNAFGTGHNPEGRRRHLRMSPDEMDRFAWSLVNRSVMLEGALLSLDGEDVREGMVASAHALCEARDAKRPLKLTLGGGLAAREQVDAARARISSELAELGDLIEAAKPTKDAGPLSMKTAGGPKANPRVVHLQNRLNSLGHQLQSDGRFGEMTAEAVKDFQTKIDVEPTGEIDDMTAEALRNGGKPKPTPEEIEAQKQAMLARQQGNQPAEGPGGEQNKGEADAATTTSNGDSSGSRARTVTIKLSEADSKGDMPQGQMPSVCPKCGARIKKQGVCQRGHRVLGAPTEYKLYSPITETWSPESRAAALLARREHSGGHTAEVKRMIKDPNYSPHRVPSPSPEDRLRDSLGVNRKSYQSAVGHEIRVGDHVHVPNHIGEESGVFGQVTRRSRRNGMDIAHVKLPSGSSKGVHTQELEHMSSAEQAEHEANVKPKVQSFSPKKGPSPQQMVENYKKMHGKDPSPAMLKKLGLKEGLDPAWMLAEDWAAWDAARKGKALDYIQDAATTDDDFKSVDHLRSGRDLDAYTKDRLRTAVHGSKPLPGKESARSDALQVLKHKGSDEYKRHKRDDMLHDYNRGDMDEAWTDEDRVKAAAARKSHANISWNKKSKRLEGTYHGVPLERGTAYQGKLATGEVFTSHWTGEVNGSDGEPIFKHVDDGRRRTYSRGKFFGKLSDVRESAQTAALSSTHAPIGKGGTNWVTRSKPGNTGQLPAYIQNIRNALIRNGKPESSATAIAIGTCKRWARGGGNVHPEVRAAAAKAIAEWEAMKGASHVKSAARKAT